MKDRIPKNNGKNNIIKTSLLPNTYDEFKLLAETGTLYADVIANNDGSGTNEIGTPLNKANLLSDKTGSIIGADNVDSALYRLQTSIPNNYCLLRIKAINPETGQPMANYRIDGIPDSEVAANKRMTDNNGELILYVTGTRYTLSINNYVPIYADTSNNISVSCPAGKIVDVIIPQSIANDRQQVKITTSQQVRFSPAIKRFDVFGVGGGGGDGGGGGYTTTMLDIKNTNQNMYVYIGGGGSGYHYGTTNGGATTIPVLNFTANGGKSSGYSRDGGSGGSGGVGDTSYSSLKAGDGGSDGSDGSTPYSYHYDYGKGQGTTTRAFGEPYGELFAGGGGGCTYDRAGTDPVTNFNGGNGGSGCVIFRIYTR